MALPSSGTISMNSIRTELGVSAQAPFSLNSARSGTYSPLNPYSPSLPPATGQVSLSSWYNYCHTCTILYSFQVYKAQNHYPQNWTSATDACNGSRDNAWAVYSSSSSLGVGSTLYALSGTVYYEFTVSGTPDSAIWIWGGGTGGQPLRLGSSSSNVVAEVGSCCPPYGTYLGGPFCEASVLDCFPNESEVNMYADGSCGVYYVWTGNCC